MLDSSRTANDAIPAPAESVAAPPAPLEPASGDPVQAADGSPSVPQPPSSSNNGQAPVSAAAVSVTSADVEDDLIEQAPWSDIWLYVPSWLTSTALHLTLVVVLALLTTTKYIMPPTEEVEVSTVPADPNGGDSLEGNMMESSGPLDQPSDKVEALTPPLLSDLSASAPLADMVGVVRPEQLSPGVELKGIGEIGLPGATGGGTGGNAPAGIGDGSGNSLELRLSGAHREGLVRSGGGTADSEKAVAMALHWLSEHQNYDGSWTFAHDKSPKCHGACHDPGYAPGKVAATSLALLPFLGTGQTHQEGQYRRTIDLGLKFLVRTIQMEGDMGSLFEQGGQMYGHGLAAIVLCEAYGMTHDQTLQGPAQAAVNFIVRAQDPVGGGWRYVPQQPGDTSVVGWQLMALKSAQMAYLRVPPATMRKADYFLDHVQSERGSVYGYTGPEARRPATTAIGLLCRMYLGWHHDMAPLERGVHILSVLGPSIDSTANKNNMYYNYYATQVMHHFGGYKWQRWNEVMREYLIKTQSKRGHETGSWYFDGSDHGGAPGGRLYFTAMAAMTLEVYYRYMPLYRPQSTQ